MTDQDLTPSERRALDKLPRDRMPSEFLEERIARALRERGLLRTWRTRAMEWTPFRVAAAAAGCLFFVVAGFAVGRWTSPTLSRNGQAYAPAQQAHELALAASLQQAASDYVEALEELETSLRTTGDEGARQGREVALASLYSAAGRVARIVPADEVADRFREAVTASSRKTEHLPGEAASRRLVEF
jgi:hypothetical protein